MARSDRPGPHMASSSLQRTLLAVERADLPSATPFHAHFSLGTWRPHSAPISLFQRPRLANRNAYLCIPHSSLSCVFLIYFVVFNPGLPPLCLSSIYMFHVADRETQQHRSQPMFRNLTERMNVLVLSPLTELRLMILTRLRKVFPERASRTFCSTTIPILCLLSLVLV